jgi:hypothetical protein
MALLGAVPCGPAGSCNAESVREVGRLASEAQALWQLQTQWPQPAQPGSRHSLHSSRQTLKTARALGAISPDVLGTDKAAHERPARPFFCRVASWFPSRRGAAARRQRRSGVAATPWLGRCHPARPESPALTLQLSRPGRSETGLNFPRPHIACIGDSDPPGRPELHIFLEDHEFKSPTASGKPASSQSPLDHVSELSLGRGIRVGLRQPQPVGTMALWPSRATARAGPSR